METPYGEIPDNLAKDMRPQEMHDYLQKRYGRRTLLKGAAAAGALAATGPIFWRQADAFAAPVSGVKSPPTSTGETIDANPQWVAYGPDPATSFWVSWSAGTYKSNVIPARPLLQYSDDLADLVAGGGQVVYPSVGQVPVPNPGLYGTLPAGNVDDTFYISALIEDLAPDTTYYYRVTVDGANWLQPAQGYAYFTTAKAKVRDFTFAATGDENENANTASVVASILAYDPEFTIVAGDLSYASGGVETLGKIYGQSDSGATISGYSPGSWDGYFSHIAEAAQYIPWIVGVGNHEMEPLTAAGYAGVLTRFPDLAHVANGGSNTEIKGSSFVYRGQSFDWNGYSVKNGTRYYTGSPVVRAFTYGNVAFVQLDGNDISAEIANNNGYTDGQQTQWLVAKLAEYRSVGSGIDFVLVYFHNCPYCSNQTHGSDAGVRNVWQPIFDRFNVDLVVNGHVHAYERSNPLYNNVAQKQIASGDTYVNFYTDGGKRHAPSSAVVGTTYICAGGGGQSLYTSWYGVSGQDGAADEASDPNYSANSYVTGTSPFVDVWEVGGEVEAGSATGAPAGASGQYSGGSTVSDPAYEADNPYSAFRFSTWSHLVINVKAPTRPGGETSLEILSVDANVTPTVVQDSVTIVRQSVVDGFGPFGL